MSFPVKAQDLIVINSNDLHSIENLGSNLSYYVIIIDVSLFRSSFVDACETKYIAPIVQNLILFKNKVNADKKVMQCIAAMIQEYEAKDFGFKLAVKSSIYNLLVLLLRNHVQKVLTESEYKVRVKNQERFYGALKYIEERYSETITLKQLADQTNISVFHFSRLFKEITGKSPVEYINSIRVNKAEDLLRNTNLNITEIAMSTGFGDINYFSRIFKKVKKASPSKYRKQKL